MTREKKTTFAHQQLIGQLQGKRTSKFPSEKVNLKLSTNKRKEPMGIDKLADPERRQISGLDQKWATSQPSFMAGGGLWEVI